jgi:hypothetical protein
MCLKKCNNLNIGITACIVLYRNDITMLREAIDSFLNTDLNLKLHLIDKSPTDELKILVQIRG